MVTEQTLVQLMSSGLKDPLTEPRRGIVAEPDC